MDDSRLEERTETVLPYLIRIYRELDSYRKLANRVNSNPETVRKMLVEGHVPSEKTLRKIEKALGLVAGKGGLPEPNVEAVRASGNERLVSWLAFLIDVLQSRDVELPLLIRIMRGREDRDEEGLTQAPEARRLRGRTDKAAGGDA